MIHLTEPDRQYLPSYQEAYDEYARHAVSTYSFGDADAQDLLEKYRRYAIAQDLPPNHVGADYYWLVDEETNRFIGEISIRHRLNDVLMRYGGHIGYGVRYSCWNQGYGTKMLGLALQKARERGLTNVLLTCDEDNAASARVMEKNGAVLENTVRNVINGREVMTRRYWINLEAK